MILGFSRIKSNLPVQLVSSFLIVLTTNWNFKPLSFPWWGDDLILWNNFLAYGGYNSSLEMAAFQFRMNKFRPVTQLFQSAMFTLFGSNIIAVNFLVILILFLGSILVGIIVKNLTGYGNYQFILGALVVGMSKFTWYSSYQVPYGGIMEALALVFILAHVHSLLIFIQTEKKNFLILSSVFYLLAILTHERYLLIGLFLTIYLKILEFKKRKKYSNIIFLPTIFLLANLSIKSFILNINSIQGSLVNYSDFSPIQLLHYFFINLKASTLELFGLSVYVNQVDKIVLGFITILAISSLVFLRNTHALDQIAALTIIFTASMMPVLVEPQIQERFLFVPSVIFVVIVFAAIMKMRINYVYFIFVFLLVLSFTINYKYKYIADNNLNNVSYLYSNSKKYLDSPIGSKWFLQIENRGDIENTWAFGYLDASQPERLGFYSQFKNPPIIININSKDWVGNPCVRILIIPTEPASFKECL